MIYNITLPESIEVLEYTSRMSGREGVRLYKALHRTVQRVFKGDMAAMFAARDKVTTFCKQHPCRLLKVISSGVQ